MTTDGSECITIEREPGSAMLAVKLEIRKPGPSNPVTISIPSGCEINRTKALIVVEHDMQFIRMIANQVTVFNEGSILVEDGVENILRNPLVRDIYLGKQAAA